MTPEQLVKKYDRAATEGYAERAWANLRFDMHRRLAITTAWGTPLQPGDSVLELGCGDGYLAQLFVQHGLRYAGVDITPKMIALAEQRLQKAGLDANFMVADVSQLSLSQPFDAVISNMGGFFTYVSDPGAVLRRLRPSIRKKIILDVNAVGAISLDTAVSMLREAGFRNVTWRPFFIPRLRKLPVSILKTLVVCESIPILRSLSPLRRRFFVLLKGETGQNGSQPDGL